MTAPTPKPRKGPEPEVLKVTVPVAEGLRRLVTAPPITKARSRYSKRKRGKRAG